MWYLKQYLFPHKSTGIFSLMPFVCCVNCVVTVLVLCRPMSSLFCLNDFSVDLCIVLLHDIVCLYSVFLWLATNVPFSRLLVLIPYLWCHSFVLLSAITVHVGSLLFFHITLVQPVSWAFISIFTVKRPGGITRQLLMTSSWRHMSMRCFKQRDRFSVRDTLYSWGMIKRPWKIIQKILLERTEIEDTALNIQKSFDKHQFYLRFLQIV